MTLKQYNPITPSMRFKVGINKQDLWKKGPYKKLTKGIPSTGGRNNQGKITSYHRGGGHKRKYRIIDFRRSLINIPASVIRLEYDPNRSSWIALVKYSNGVVSYILAPQGISVGDIVESGTAVSIKTGNSLPLKNIPIGTLIHNVEQRPGKGGQIARSAGSYIQLIKQSENEYVMLRLPSGEQKMIHQECMATVGVLSNSDHKNINLGKAGTNRWLGKRPVVRGVAMNPVDHPHGGGEGKTSGGKSSVTPWGKPTKGMLTRSPRKTNKFIVSRRKK